MKMAPGLPLRARGFTLIEVLLVIVLLSILAATTFPAYFDSAQDCQVAPSVETVKMVQRRIDEYHVRNGAYPEQIDPAWFAPPGMPRNPFEPSMQNTLAYIAASKGPQKIHPADKSTNLDIYWYNPTNGRFRMRVPWQGDNASTLALYNRANDARASSYTDEETR